MTVQTSNKRKAGRPRKVITKNSRTPHNVHVMLTDDEYDYIVTNTTSEERRAMLLANYRPQIVQRE